jgi:hypothetical protein
MNNRLYVIAQCENCGSIPMASVFPYQIEEDNFEKAQEAEALVNLINKGYTIKTTAICPTISKCICEDSLRHLSE